MGKSDRVLALDVGSGKMVLAEFFVKAGVAPRLLKYATGKLPEDASSSVALAEAVRELMAAGRFAPGPVLISLPGQSVFPRFVKLPPVSAEKIASMVEYEAEQNVPFPLAEVVWDYQILKGATDLEVNALLVAVKRDGVTTLTEGMAQAGLKPEIIEAAPTALYNAVRFNYPEVDGCVMVLDIGAKATNLIFIEEGKCFTRSIPVAGNAITQEIAKAMNVSPDEAEHLKQDVGFVALGGVYAMAEDETADKVSKIIRNVVTRLHAEVNRSVNFYKSQQEGSAPVRVLLTGGTSLIPYIDTFFREKMQVDVEYLNPFINVAVESSAAKGDADTMKLIRLGNVVGLALRRAARCPVEINLLPPEVAAQRAFTRRIPFFAAAIVGFFITLCCWYLYAGKVTGIEEAQRDNATKNLSRIKQEQALVDQVLAEQRATTRKIATVQAMAEARTRCASTLEYLRERMLSGMWVTGVVPEKAADGHGFAKIRVDGRAYEDILRQDYGDGVLALDAFLEAMTAEGSPFLPKNAGNPAAGSRIVQNPLVENGVFRSFRVEFVLRAPLGVITELGIGN